MLAANPWLILGCAFVAIGALGGAYVKGRSDGRALEFAERATMEEVAREAREASMQAAADAIAKISVKHTTIQQKAQVVTRDVPVYRDCVNDERIIRLLDAARENRPFVEPAGSSELPGAGASPTPNLR